MGMYQDDRTWSEPLCLVRNDEIATFQVVESTLQKLREIDCPVSVISIIGPYRSGKSCLLNYLADIQSGFEVSDSVQGLTKGIYVYSRPHPSKPDLQLLYLDTEGLFDVDKDKDEENDTSVFLLTTLLSSCLIYNSRGTIDQLAITNLSFVTEIANKLKVLKSENFPEDCDALISIFFPDFVWLVRDFTLTLKQNDRATITADDYLDNALAVKEGNSAQIKKLNAIRNRIRLFFAKRTCFVLPTMQPNGSLLSDQDNNIDEDTLNKCHKLRQHVWESSQPKEVAGHVFDGKRFAALAEKYSAILAEGKIPCIEMAMKRTADEVNRYMLKELLQQYTNYMSCLKLPTEDLETLERQHELSVSQIIEKANTSFMYVDQDSSSDILKELLDAINESYKIVKKKNEDISMQTCRKILDSSTATQKSKLNARCYEVPGGYAKCQAELEEAIRLYNATPGKGVKALEALQEYEQFFSEQAMLILKIDQTMTQAEKVAKESQMREELLKRKLKIAKKERRETERRLAEQDKESDTAQGALEIKLDELDEVNNKKLQETVENMQQEFAKERAKLKEQINYLANHRRVCVIS